MVALRERGTDVELIARHFISDFATEISLGICLAEEAARKLSDYNWNQNVIELSFSSVKHYTNMEGNTLDLAAIEKGERKVQFSSIEIDEDGFKLMSLKEAEKLLIKKLWSLLLKTEHKQPKSLVFQFVLLEIKSMNIDAKAQLILLTLRNNI